MKLSRRQLIQSSALLGTAALLPSCVTEDPTTIIKAEKSTAQILPDSYPKTDVWSYNGSLPGPVLRIKQDDWLSVRFENHLDVDSTIHWHGVRLPNIMDGVPYITQQPVKPDHDYNYRFQAKDSGTFWYHPHQNSAEQVDRGLSGVLIVEEAEKIDVDQDIVWMLDDWRLGENGKIINDYPNLHDRAHGGRLGNVLAVNGQMNPTFNVDNGSRIRLRLINSSNARMYSPYLSGQQAWIIAFDGQPIEPKEFKDGILRLGPGMRADLIVDIAHDPNLPLQVFDNTYRGGPQPLAQFKVSGSNKTVRKTAVQLPPNPLSVPDLANAIKETVVYEGGAMGRLRTARLNGETETSLQELAQKNGLVWATNTNSYASLEDLNNAKRLFDLKLGQSYIFELVNNTAWVHPIHLHGHTYQVISRNGKKLPTPLWQDTALIYPNEKIEVAFVADNPGDWMFHCHILDHAASGMIAAIKVS